MPSHGPVSYDPEQEWFSPSQAGMRLGLSRSYICTLIYQGELPASRLPARTVEKYARWRIAYEDLKAFGKKIGVWREYE